MATPNHDAGSPILTTAQAAEFLQVHVEYLRRMVREGRVPAHRFPGGREIRFLRDELIEWLRAQGSEDQSGTMDTQGAATPPMRSGSGDRT